jgi:hypothetical protein
MPSLLTILKRRLTIAGAACVMSSCGHPDKAAAIHQIEQETKCSFVREGTTTIVPVEGTELAPKSSGSPGPTSWLFQAMVVSKSGQSVPIEWAVPEYPDKEQVSIAYWGARSEAGVILKYLEEHQKGE